MSQISNALKKIAESRRNQQESKPAGIVYLTDAPKSWPKTALMVVFAVGTIAAISIGTAAVTIAMKNSESRQIQVLSLEKTIKAQEKRIDDFITAINKNQKFTDSQIQDLNFRLNEENKTENGHYDNLKESIIDNKQQIDSLVQYTKTLDQKITAMSAANNQVKDVTSPASGN